MSEAKGDNDSRFPELEVPIRDKSAYDSRFDRNTLDFAILNGLVIKTEIEKQHSLKLNTIHDGTCSDNNVSQKQTQQKTSSMISTESPKLIESCNRFRSVRSRPIACRISAPPSSNYSYNNKVKEVFKHQANIGSRIEFHEAFSHLIKLRGIDKTSKTLITQEEQLWQTEVKDLIWLELQAWHSKRNLEDEDFHLCTARQTISTLLLDIMNYKFDRSSYLIVDKGKRSVCPGCISIHCISCSEIQVLALKQIESLLNRLEEAEKLYPSTKAMGNHYPLYKSEAFIDRVKAMCLWYNMTQHHRLKLLILQKVLTSFDTNQNYTNQKQLGTSYRHYIEEILKSRGIAKSLLFLNRLYTVVLRKAQLTLENVSETTESDIDTMPIDDFDIDSDQIFELKRYGLNSKELKELMLPSYIPAFLYLSKVPVEVIGEFLNMLLETTVLEPNILNLEQLIKELREGLQLAILFRQRYKKHISTVTSIQKSTNLQLYKDVLVRLNTIIHKSFELYLDFVLQLVTQSSQSSSMETLTKWVLIEEWNFTKSNSPLIFGGHVLAAKKFCEILKLLFHNRGKSLEFKIKCLDNQVSKLESLNSSSEKWQLLSICRETQQIFTDEREKFLKIVGFSKTLCRDIEKPDFHKEHSDKRQVVISCNAVSKVAAEMKHEARQFHYILTKTIKTVQDRCSPKNLSELDETDYSAVISRTREILHQSFKFGFEYHKELQRLHDIGLENSIDSSENREVSMMVIDFAKQWIQFVQTICEPGRGVKPRWAAHGFDFLILACDPFITSHLSDKEFDDLKNQMDDCISHVVGKPEKIKKSPRTRKATLSRPGVQQPNFSNKIYMSQLSVRSEGTTSGYSSSIPSSPDVPITPGNTISFPAEKSTLSTKLENHLSAIKQLESTIDSSLRTKGLIGRVKEDYVVKKVPLKAKSLNFSWHRGIKIGQGRFGKVYTAVNNATGELIAMKEIPIQPGETEAINRVVEEMKIFEGLTHNNLVKYFGIEIHREELLIFMELCPEGTLESYVELSGGLPEIICRQYTYQLLLAVRELHTNGIVHRDIKPANIFLVDDRKHLKLGDFGSAVKIESNTTMPGELRSYVGTQAYMAPEVFTKNNAEGHGRAVDIWSVGCCVIEMVSGKRPWHFLDSNFQIMFKVGMGEVPETPASLSSSGKTFVELCLQHSPDNRKSASELLLHEFCCNMF